MLATCLPNWYHVVMPEDMKKEALKERREWLHAFYCSEQDVESDMFGEYIISQFEDGLNHLVRLPWHLNLTTIYSSRKTMSDVINYPVNLVEV